MIPLLVIASLDLSCRIAPNKYRHLGGFPARAGDAVRVTVIAEPAESTAEIVQALRQIDSIDSVEGPPQEWSRGNEGPCESGSCRGDRPTLCAQLQRRGVDFAVFAHSAARYARKTECVSYEFNISRPKADECKRDRTTFEGTTARLSVEMVETLGCRKVPGHELSQVFTGDEEQSRVQAQAWLRRARADLVTRFRFPAQATVVTDADGAARTSRETLDTDVVAAFRGPRYLGLARLDRRDHGLHALTCCFDWQAGDAVQARERFRLWEFGLHGSATRVRRGDADKTLAGLGIFVRTQSVDGGTVLGVGAETLGSRELGVAQISLDAGYLWQPVGGFSLTPRVAGGLAVGLAADGDVSDRETQWTTRAGLEGRWTPRPFVYLWSELAYVHTPSYMLMASSVQWAGPLLRIGAGFELY